MLASDAGELSGTGNALATLAAIVVGAAVYFILILVTRAISKEDLSMMPKGDKNREIAAHPLSMRLLWDRISCFSCHNPQNWKKTLQGR